MTGVTAPVTAAPAGLRKPSLLLIEDDVAVANFILAGLGQNGFTTTHVQRGDDGLQIAGSQSFDLLIIDRMLPGLSGLDLLKQLRTGGVTTPALILSNLSGLDERVEGLNVGADDYLGKPFALVELVARLNALLRRPRSSQAPAVLSIGELVLDRFARTVFIGRREVTLQNREFALLERLLLTPGRIVTRTMLLEDVWHFHFDPKTRIVETHISRLRTKLAAEYIHTVRSAGYLVRAPKADD